MGCDSERRLATPASASASFIPDPPANAHLLAIGISKYLHIPPLPVVRDAQDLHEVLHDPAIGAYASVAVPPLLEREATKQAIVAALQELARRTDPASSVVFYFSGHGLRAVLRGEPTFFLLPIDADVSSEARLEATALSGPELAALFRAIPAARFTVILDCCRAGGLADPKDPQLDCELTADALALFSGGNGRAVLAASSADGCAYVVRGQRNGVFTDLLLQGLRGGAASRSGAIHVARLYDFVEERVSQRFPQQRCVFKADYETNYVIARCRRPSLGELSRAPLLGALSVLISAGFVGALRPAPEEPECYRALREGAPHAAASCAERYEHTRDPLDLNRAGEASLARGAYDEARKTVARLAMDHPGQEHYLQSLLILHTEPENAQEALKQAGTAYHNYQAGSRYWQMKAALARAEAALQLGQLETAIQMAETVISLADASGASWEQVRARVLLADAALRLGDEVEAIIALNLAAVWATHPCEKASISLARGALETEIGDADRAERELVEAEEAWRRCSTETESSELVFARIWLARRRAADARRNGQAAEVARAVAQEQTWIERLRAGDRDGLEGLLLRAHRATDAMDLRAAAHLLKRAAALPVPEDRLAEISRLRAALAERSGGIFSSLAAGYHYRHAVKIFEPIRTHTRTRTVCIERGRCRTHDGFLAFLARAGRYSELFTVLVDLDAGDRRKHTPISSRSFSQNSRLGLLPPSAVPPEELLDQRGQGLVILVAPIPRKMGRGGEHAYRLYIADGKVHGEDIGSAEEVWQWCDALRRDVRDRSAAEVLGRALIPTGAEPVLLRVLMTAPLAGVPLEVLPSSRMLEKIHSLQSDSPTRSPSVLP